MPATVTINQLQRVNPGLFIRESDVGTDSPALVVDDSMAPTARFGAPAQDYVLLAQMCSIMSVYWIQNHSHKALRQLDADAQREAALTVYANPTPDSQFDWARTMLAFEEADSLDAVASLALEPQGTRNVLLYSDRHVSAATIGADGILYFDPETGNAEAVDADEFMVYLTQAQRALIEPADPTLH
jgi:hypothetical protein